jgi:HlyD family secretion protein
MSNGCNRFWSIWCSCRREADACNTGLLALALVAAGQGVLTILDLNDVYMTVYLPADMAGNLTLGDEARVIVDPIPQYVIPATIGFVATEAQFTPKSVETAEERQKLMFRVKLQGDPKVLDRYHRQVKQVCAASISRAPIPKTLGLASYW